MPKNTLFLHMGPGLNASVERQVLGAHRPEVHFWDQPHFHDKSNAFEKLVAAAVEQVDLLYTKNHGQPVHLFAHSFGGHIATEILRQVPEKIATCEFASTGFHIAAGFFHLLTAIRQAPFTSIELKNEIREFQASHPRPLAIEFWEYVALVVKEPSFMSLYWPDAELFETYKNLASQAPSLDFLAFNAVATNFLNLYFSESPQPIDRAPRVSISFGDQDPLIHLETEQKLWRRVFPNAEFHIRKNSGHYTHLEPFLHNC